MARAPDQPEAPDPPSQQEADNMSTATARPASGRLSGKTALVTGAARGIGRATAQRFATESAVVVCADLDEAGLRDTVAAITQAGGQAHALPADVCNATTLINDALAATGRLDILHANAAAQVMGDLLHTAPQDWDRMYAVNQRAVAESIRAVIPHMRAQGGGSIIITASLLALTGDPDLAMYGATKGALRALSRSVATAAGPDNIRCNTLCPGDVDTEMVREFFAYQTDPVAARRDIEQKYPLRRIAQPEDVANAALFLASDESSYITGTDIVIDGGLLARIY
jgi:NAD(P)-dependent dehydrogenase (short-subunit alcohol dehydrogenase family)